MSDATEQLHHRFCQQAAWTRAIRQRAFSQFALPTLQSVLEVGSGTGAITSEIRETSSALVIGLDRDPRANAFARTADVRATCVTGLGEQLPFPPASFDLTCCHFLLLWVPEPLPVLLEMTRVTRPGGGVLCLAEPDYGGRIDYPEDLAELGTLQEEALRARGAETRLGRRLRALLHQAGLADVEAGVLGGEWSDDSSPAEAQQDLEWRTLADDLTGRVAPATLRRLEANYTRSRREGSHILFVPTFFAWGRRRSHP
jgi:SAM-dependent methyltransferase